MNGSMSSPKLGRYVRISHERIQASVYREEAGRLVMGGANHFCFLVFEP